MLSKIAIYGSATSLALGASAFLFYQFCSWYKRRLNENFAINVCKQAIESYATRDITRADVKFIVLAGGISALSVLKVTDCAGKVPPLVVRVDRPDNEAAKKAATLATELAKVGAGPKIYHHGPSQQGYVTIMGFVNGGNPQEGFLRSTANCCAYGKLMARLHRIPNKFIAPFSSQVAREPKQLAAMLGMGTVEVSRALRLLGSYPCVYAEMTDGLRAAGLAEDRLKKLHHASRLIMLQAHELMRSPMTSRLVCGHGDAHPGNLLWQDQQHSGLLLIDLETAASMPAAFDLAVPLTAKAGEGSPLDNRRMLLDWYLQSLGNLESGSKRCLKIVEANDDMVYDMEVGVVARILFISYVFSFFGSGFYPTVDAFIEGVVAMINILERAQGDDILRKEVVKSGIVDTHNRITSCQAAQM